MGTAELVSALEAVAALDGAALVPIAARLSHLAHLAHLADERSSLRFPRALALEALPDALIARVLSLLPATHLARANRLSTAFCATHVPAAMAIRVAQLQLTESSAEARIYKSPLHLLLTCSLRRGRLQPE